MCPSMSKFSTLLSQKEGRGVEMSKMSKMSLYFIPGRKCEYCLYILWCVSGKKSKEKVGHPGHLANPPPFLRKNGGEVGHTWTSAFKSLLFQKESSREVFQFRFSEGFHLNWTLPSPFCERTILILDMPLYLFSPPFSPLYLSPPTSNGPKTPENDKHWCLRSWKRPLSLRP